MLEPLLHLVRNAASHGIESARRSRRGAASRPTGRSAPRAAPPAIASCSRSRTTAPASTSSASRSARARSGSIAPDELARARRRCSTCICSSGFSTRETADMTSGRGVGMAVVRDDDPRLGGELFVHSAARRGTRFTIELPLTLMITDALILEIGDQSMAIPQVALREIVPLDPSAVTRLENNEVLSYRGTVVPLVNLGSAVQARRRPERGAPRAHRRDRRAPRRPRRRPHRRAARDRRASRDRSARSRFRASPAQRSSPTGA